MKGLMIQKTQGKYAFQRIEQLPIEQLFMKYMKKSDHSSDLKSEG